MCYMTYLYITYIRFLQVDYNLNNTHLRSFLGHPDRRLEDCLLNERLEELLRRKLMNGYHEDCRI